MSDQLPLTSAQRQTATQLPWYRQWLRATCQHPGSAVGENEPAGCVRCGAFTVAARCTCVDYDPEQTDEDCVCQACSELARILAACPHRLEQVVSGEARNDRLYDGLCDDCFEQARDVRACGLRIAEHVANPGPPP